MADKSILDTLEISSEFSNHTLDPITVYWRNYGGGHGEVTVTCYGSAWTAYFGAMGDRTIQQFFADADVEYVVSKLGMTQWLKNTKSHESYLTKIICAIKSALARGGQQ